MPQESLPIHSRDEKDDALLACAFGGNCDYLVTGDEDLLVLNGKKRIRENANYKSSRVFAEKRGEIALFVGNCLRRTRIDLRRGGIREKEGHKLLFKRSGTKTQQRWYYPYSIRFLSTQREYQRWGEFFTTGAFPLTGKMGICPLP
jgi:hypothetical protein